MKRERYIPKGSTKITHKATGAVVYTYTSARGRLCAIGYSGKRSKGDFHYAYRTEAERAKRIADYFKSLQSYAAQKAEWAAKRRAPSKLEPDTILSGSWGYDQTNVEFWIVNRLIGKCSVEVQQVRCTQSDQDEYGQSERLLPTYERYGEPVVKRVQFGDSVSFNHFILRVWDGRARTQTHTH